MAQRRSTIDDFLAWLASEFANGALTVGSITNAHSMADTSGIPYARVRRGVGYLQSRGIVESRSGMGVRFLRDPRAVISSTVGLVVPSTDEEVANYTGLVGYIRRAAEASGLGADIRTYGLNSQLDAGHLANSAHWHHAHICLTANTTADQVCRLLQTAQSPGEDASPGLHIPFVAIGPAEGLENSVNWNLREAGAVASAHVYERLSALSSSSDWRIYFCSAEDSPEARQYRDGCADELGLPVISRVPASAAVGSVRPLTPRDAGRILAVEMKAEFGEFLEKRRGSGPAFAIVALGREFAEGLLEGLEHSARIQVPRQGLVVAVENDGSRAGSFLSTVQPDMTRLAEAAWRAGQSLPAGRVAVPKACTLRGRRSSHSWLHKLFKGFYGSIVIKDLESRRFRHGNPAFEELARKRGKSLIDQRTTDYWPEPIGQRIAEFDQIVSAGWKSGTPRRLLTLEEFRQPGRNRNRFTFRFPFESRSRQLIGTLGFDISNQHLLVLLPASSNGDEPADPDDACLEDFFDALPCSVLLEDVEPETAGSGRLTLYANRAYRNLWPEAAKIVGECSTGYRGEYPNNLGVEEIIGNRGTGMPQWVPLTLLRKTTPPPGARGRQRSVLYFYLYDSYYRECAVASVGWDYELLAHVQGKLEDLQAIDPEQAAVEDRYVEIDEFGFPLPS